MTAELVEHVRRQAAACAELGSPMYGVLLQRLAADVEQGGPGADILSTFRGDPEPAALALRLMGGVHRLVLQRRAGALALHYPSVRGDGDAAAAWPLVRELLTSAREELTSLLDQAPQTNEVGRAAALIGALQVLVSRRPRPVRLVELGASGGLNLLADRFRIEARGRRRAGPETSPVVLADAWDGALPPEVQVQIVFRAGCDTEPLDPTSPEGRLRLTSFVWPDQRERLERLRGAFAVTREAPVRVERSGAADFLTSLRLQPGTTTVVWHSVMWQYLSPGEQTACRTRIEELGRLADGETGLAHVRLEPRRQEAGQPTRFLVELSTWPDGGSEILGTAHPHGVPVVWSDRDSG